MNYSEGVFFVVEHIVCFKLKPEATPEQEQKLIDLLQGLKTQVPTVIDLTAGKTFVPKRGAGYTVGLVARFNDKAGLEAYGPHPAHQALIGYINEVCESVMAVDYEF